MSNPQKTELKIDKTAKVSVLKNEENPNDQLLIVLHGYGQLSQFFIQKFSSLTHQCDIIAPEGMHRFYLNGSSGRVGASWMTKEERETDIEDNQKYLEEVLS
ncbi:MAG: putative esterase, partial [Lentimonas sp.]